MGRLPRYRIWTLGVQGLWSPTSPRLGRPTVARRRADPRQV